jgi:cobalt/nickel transport system permease protein
MISEPFALGNSLLHRADPRIKVIFASLYSFAVAMLNRFPSLTAALFISVVLIFLARINLRELGARLLIVNGLVLLFWLLLPLTFKGEHIFSVGPFAVSGPGIVYAAQITLKSNAILLAFIASAATSSLVTLGHAMNRLHVPEKIIHLLLLTYRYVFVIEQEYRKLCLAAKVRCFAPKTDMHTYRTYSYLLGMLFVRAAARAERVHQAMLCRGFKGKFYCLSEFSLTRTDMILAVLMAGALIVLEMLEWTEIIIAA